MPNQDRKRQIITHLMQISIGSDGEERHLFFSGKDKNEQVATAVIQPCLKICNRYRRSTGRFEISALLAWSESIYRIIKDNVKIDILTYLAMNDRTLTQLEKIQDEEETVRLINKTQQDILRDAIDFKRNPEKHTRSQQEILTWLIANDRLEIKFAWLRDHDHRDIGMFHNKCGYFEFDESVTMAFLGGFNETHSGHYTNAESLTMFFSYRQENQKGLEEAVNQTDKLWKYGDDKVEVAKVDAETLSMARDLSQGKPPPRKEIKRLQTKTKKVETKQIDESKLWTHQLQTINDWQDASNTGLAEHATGSGKTWTALFALRRHFKQHSSALILVPTLPLFEQWHEDIQIIIPKAQILRVGGGHNRWKDSKALAVFTRKSADLEKKKVVLAINNSARSEEFLSKLSNNNELFVIADEVHNLGSRENSRIFKIKTSFKLGLSATPERYMDPEGTEKIFNFFGETLPTTYSLEQAVAEGRLVPYDYYPTSIKLTESEQDDFDEQSENIRRLIGKCRRDINKKIIPSKSLELAIFERSRIVKKAKNKIPQALKILKEYYDNSHQWLIYCDSMQQIEDLTEVLNLEGFDPFAYHSYLSKYERESALLRFKSAGGILLSIKCLDEGFNLPSVSHALIMASDQNPRQFIQRRGRVLRKDDQSNKKFASIFDLIVATSGFHSDEMKAFVKTELKRAHIFSNSSRNNNLSGARVRSIATLSDINLQEDFVLSDKGDNIYETEEIEEKING